MLHGGFLAANSVANLEAKSIVYPVRAKRVSDAANGGRWWAILLLVLLVGGWYAGSHLMRGWIPADEGAYANSAERVLQGELPHRDYIENYTGGLAYLHALAFYFFGKEFSAMRIPLFLFFLAWLAVFFWIASRIVSDCVAGAVALLAVAWGLPNYSAAVPSWYNLFFATFAMGAIFRFLDKGSRKWLFLAGISAGCSILAKIPGVYLVAALLLFFAFREQNQCVAGSADEKSGGKLYSYFLFISVALFICVLARLLLARGGLEELTDFVLPAASLSGVLVLRERHRKNHSDGRFFRLLGMLVPFALGILVPTGMFFARYIKEHAVGLLLRGMFVLPFARVSSSASESPPPIPTILPSLCLGALLVAGIWLRGRARLLFTAAIMMMVGYFLVSSRFNPRTYQVAWYSAYWLIPVVVVAGATALLFKPANETEGPALKKDQQTFLVLAIAALCSLVQYPFSTPIYFCYVSPLAILAATAVINRFPAIPKGVLATLFLGFLLFAVFRVTPPFLIAMGKFYQSDPETRPLNLQRAGALRVEPEAANIYQHLVDLVRQKAGNGEVYAVPDCPQVYFLTGYKNITRNLFEMFDEKYPDLKGTVELVDKRPIRVVVLNSQPDFSATLPSNIRDALATRFPHMERVGPFEVRWRD
jgi:hypothetical protein